MEQVKDMLEPQQDNASVWACLLYTSEARRARCEELDAVNADADAACGGHAVFQRFNEVVVHALRCV